MSRVAKSPVVIPAGVEVTLAADKISVKGSGGTLSLAQNVLVKVANNEGKVSFEPANDSREANAMSGTVRQLVNNMVLGVSKGWKRSLEINGVGYSAKVEGKDLVLTVGYSHDVRVLIPESVVCKLEKNSIQLESPDRALLGDLAARIRKVQPPEPYLGKGIKYTEETIKRKAGKTAK